MSPTAHLRSQIFYHLDTDLLETANFLAGRLHALEPRSADSHHLLALTYLRLRRFKAAYDYSHKYGANGRHLGCAYVFAQACQQLGGPKLTEGANALEKCRSQWVGKNHLNKCSDTQRRSLPDAAACWVTLGKIWTDYGDAKKAGDCFVEAHKCNPFVWEAFEGLCKVGADLKVEKMFLPSLGLTQPGIVLEGQVKDARSAEEVQVQEKAGPLATQLNFNQQTFTPSADPFNATSKAAGRLPDGEFILPNPKGKTAATSQRAVRSAGSEWDTPTAPQSGAHDEDVMMGGVSMGSTEDFVPAAPSRRPRVGQHLDASDKPRPPVLRGQSSEVADESAQPKATVGGHKRTISGQQPSHATSVAASTTSADSQPPRRSNRLFGQGSSTKITRSTANESTAASVAGRLAAASERPAKPATGTKGRIGSTVGRVVSGNRKMLPPDRNEKEPKRAPSRNSDKNVPTSTTTSAQPMTQPPKTVQPPPPPFNQAAEELRADQASLASVLDNLRELALGLYSTTRFDIDLSIRTLRALPTAQRETPFVLAQLGKAYYECADYRAAEDCFARVLKLQPSRIEDMDVYSTVLWHLKKDTALTFLCHHLSETDYTAPQRWVAVGNAFSLSREHDQAIAAFKRATQVDEGFSYAWTLMGHEYIANEEFDAALSCFRQAVSIDRRGYGGWYGLGKSHEKMGKLEESERHYRIAASINPSNSTLLVCIGVVLERLHNKKAALANYSRALELAPQSALARFKKARVLMHLAYWSEALVELEILRDQAPDEANVWFLLGKCYKGLGERGEALRALTTALNLDVKAAPFIKEAMEALEEDEDVESDEE